MEVRLLLGAKLAIAVICAYYFLEILPYSDYKTYNMEGYLQYQLLKADPAAFFTDLGSGDANYSIGGLFNAGYSFWADIRFSLLYKVIAVFNLLTRGNLYLNSMLFSSLVFFGHVAFFRIFQDMYPRQKILLIVCCFLLPSVLMYTSCVHKDGIIFIALAAMCAVFYSFIKYGKLPGIISITVFGLAMLAIFLFRNYVLIALLPAMFTAMVCRALPVARMKVIITSYIIYSLLFFLSGSIAPSLNLPEAVVKRKADFANLLKGNTGLAMNDLQPRFTSFISNIPQALNHTLLRPYLWESPSASILLAALELLLYQILLIIFLLYRHKTKETISNFNVFGILFFVSMMLIIGYTIPNIGAIVRYRSIFWIRLLCPIVCNINWAKLRGKWLPGAAGLQ